MGRGSFELSGWRRVDLGRGDLFCPPQAGTAQFGQFPAERQPHMRGRPALALLNEQLADHLAYPDRVEPLQAAQDLSFLGGHVGHATS